MTTPLFDAGFRRYEWFGPELRPYTQIKINDTFVLGRRLKKAPVYFTEKTGDIRTVMFDVWLHNRETGKITKINISFDTYDEIAKITGCNLDTIIETCEDKGFLF